MQQPDRELETWRRQWQSHDMVPPDLRRRVEREIRMRWVAIAASIVVTLAFGIGTPAWAIVSRRVDVAVLAAAVWVFIAMNWIVSWHLGGGLSKPVATTTTAFLDFSILYCQRGRRAITAASVLCVGMLTFNLTWIYQVQPVPSGVGAFLGSGRLIVVYVITAVLAALAVRSRRKLARELRNLVDLRRQVQG